jgi:hypothetical protein
MKNLKRLLLTGIALAGIGMTGCPPFMQTDLAPSINFPPLCEVFEGRHYSYQTQVSGKSPFTYSIKETPVSSSAPEFPLFINSNGLVSGDAPNVDADTYYYVEIDVSNANGNAEQKYTLRVLNFRHP